MNQQTAVVGDGDTKVLLQLWLFRDGSFNINVDNITLGYLDPDRHKSDLVRRSLMSCLRKHFNSSYLIPVLDK